MTKKSYKIAVLLVNLGTPDAPTPPSVRAYLKEFLWDKHIVDQKRWLWWFILHSIVLPKRSPVVAKKYAEIWTPEGSPLLAITRKQVLALRHWLSQYHALSCEIQQNSVMTCDMGMRYGTPDLLTGLTNIQAQEADHLIILPLFPQYSTVTTGSIWDEITAILSTWRKIPKVTFIGHYHQNSYYVSALAETIRETNLQRAKNHMLAPFERILFSFHGLPQYRAEQDDYVNACHETSEQVAHLLSLTREQWQVAFQSRFGKQAWVLPYTDQVLKDWALSGIRHIAVLCPGFAADCLETLEEIAITGQSIFLSHGGLSYQYISGLNDHPLHIEALGHLIVNAL